jgi:hypothetical protein
MNVERKKNSAVLAACLSACLPASRFPRSIGTKKGKNNGTMLMMRMMMLNNDDDW